jgi:RING-box protein 1
MADDLQFEIDEINAFPIWGYNVIGDQKSEHRQCSICFESLEKPCASCIVENNNIVSAICKPSKGLCGHGFHYHCISKHCKTNKTCPIDQTPWTYECEDMRTEANKKKSSH